MNVDSLIDEVIGREGGYSNRPADRGGATRWGVTEKVARSHGYRGDMRTFPRAKRWRYTAACTGCGPASMPSPNMPR